MDNLILNNIIGMCEKDNALNLMKAFPHMFTEAKHLGMINILSSSDIELYRIRFSYRYTHTRDISVLERGIRTIKNALKKSNLYFEMNTINCLFLSYKEYYPFEITVNSPIAAKIVLDSLEKIAVKKTFEYYGIRVILKSPKRVYWRDQLAETNIKKPNYNICRILERSFMLNSQYVGDGVNIIDRKIIQI